MKNKLPYLLAALAALLLVWNIVNLSRNQSLRKDVSALEESQASLQTLNESLEKDLAESRLEEEITQGILDTAKEDLENQKRTLESAHESISFLEAEIAESRENAKALTASLSSVTQEKAETEKALEESRLTLGKTQEELADTAASLERASAQYQQTADALQATEKTLDETAKALSDTQTKLGETEDRLTETTSRLTQSEEMLSQKEAALKQAQEELASLTDSLAQAENAKVVAEDTAKKADAAVLALKGQLATALDEQEVLRRLLTASPAESLTSEDLLAGDALRKAISSSRGFYAVTLLATGGTPSTSLAPYLCVPGDAGSLYLALDTKAFPALQSLSGNDEMFALYAALPAEGQSTPAAGVYMTLSPVTDEETVQHLLPSGDPDLLLVAVLSALPLD